MCHREPEGRGDPDVPGSLRFARDDNLIAISPVIGGPLKKLRGFFQLEADIRISAIINTHRYGALRQEKVAVRIFFSNFFG